MARQERDPLLQIAKFAYPNGNDMLPVSVLHKVTVHASCLRFTDPNAYSGHRYALDSVNASLNEYVIRRGPLPHIGPRRARQVGEFVTAFQGDIIEHMVEAEGRDHQEYLPDVSQVIQFCEEVAGAGVVALATRHQQFISLFPRE